MIRRALNLLLRPLLRLLVRIVPIGDPWDRLRFEPKLAQYGWGARRPFGWYFEGDSAVLVQSLSDIQAWLGGCEYARDPHLFNEPDFWQHPRTFEHLRRGDCEDFAVWAWRKMVELGYDADLVVGRCVPPTASGSRHAWILFRQESVEYLYEPVWGVNPAAVRPLAGVRDKYVPEFGVGPDKRRFGFAGALHSLRDGRGGNLRPSTSLHD